jgi:hypothetical protein
MLAVVELVVLMITQHLVVGDLVAQVEEAMVLVMKLDGQIIIMAVQQIILVGLVQQILVVAEAADMVELHGVLEQQVVLE